MPHKDAFSLKEIMSELDYECTKKIYIYALSLKFREIFGMAARSYVRICHDNTAVLLKGLWWTAFIYILHSQLTFNIIDDLVYSLFAFSISTLTSLLVRSVFPDTGAKPVHNARP